MANKEMALDELLNAVTALTMEHKFDDAHVLIDQTLRGNKGDGQHEPTVCAFAWYYKSNLHYQQGQFQEAAFANFTAGIFARRNDDPKMDALAGNIDSMTKALEAKGFCLKTSEDSDEADDAIMDGLSLALGGALGQAEESFQLALNTAQTEQDRVRSLVFLSLLADENSQQAQQYMDQVLQVEPENTGAILLKDALRQSSAHPTKNSSLHKSLAHTHEDEEQFSAMLEMFNASSRRSQIPILHIEHDRPYQAPSDSSYYRYLDALLFNKAASENADARLLATTVWDAQKENRVGETIQLAHPIANLFGSGTAHSFTLQKIMASLARPCLIILNDENGEPMQPRVLYKRGDDLRQDLFVMNSFELFNAMWQNALGPENTPVIKTYGVLPMPNREGFLEWVEDSTPMLYFRWGEYDPHLWIPTLAATVVAGYAVGARDRHLRNIMISNDLENGHGVFHIDFGFILGHWPGGGIGKGPMIPVSAEVRNAMSDSQWEAFVEQTCALYGVLSDNRHALAELMSEHAAYFEFVGGHLHQSVKSWLLDELQDKAFFEAKLRRAHKNRRRIVKEYMALAFANRTTHPDEYFEWLELNKVPSNPIVKALRKTSKAVAAPLKKLIRTPENGGAGGVAAVHIDGTNVTIKPVQDKDHQMAQGPKVRHAADSQQQEAEIAVMRAEIVRLREEQERLTNTVQELIALIKTGALQQ